MGNLGEGYCAPLSAVDCQAFCTFLVKAAVLKWVMRVDTGRIGSATGQETIHANVAIKVTGITAGKAVPNTPTPDGESDWPWTP